MKRFFIIMGIVALVFSSCSKDTIKEVRKGTAIDFRASIDHGTRATETQSWNLDCFYVTAVSGPVDGSADSMDGFFFKDVPFSRIGDRFYSYPTYYWPEDNRIIAFMGYAPSADEMGVTSQFKIENINGNRELKWYINNFAPSLEIKNQVDFVAGLTLGYNEYSIANGITMNLAHALTQIEIRAYSNNSSYTYKVAGIRIANPKSAADMTHSAWPNEFTFDYKGNATAVYEDTYDSPVTLRSYQQSIMNPESGNAILLPQTLTAWDPEGDPTNQAKGVYIGIKLQIIDKNNNQVYPTQEGDYGWVAVPLGDTWKFGDKYIYTLDFSNGAGYIDPTDPVNPGKNVLGDKITFTTKLAAWDDKVTVQAKNSDLVGHWVGLKGSSIDSDDNIEHKYETAEEVEDWLGEFYDFIVPDENTLRIKNAAGEYNTPTTFNVVDNYVLMDCFRDGDGYSLKPYIQHIDESSAIIVNTFVYSSYTRVQTIYYKKMPLDE